MNKLFKTSTFLFIIFLYLIQSINVSFYNYDKKINVIYDNKTYSINLGSTISDFIKEFNIEASEIKYDYDLNLALYDNQILEKNNENNKISINSAGLDDLMSLNGIGIVIAKRIIKYRELNNGFKYLEEIKNISGIGDKKYESIKEFITL